MGHREEDLPDEKSGNGAAKDEVEEEGEAADSESRGRHGAVVGQDGVEDVGGLLICAGFAHGGGVAQSLAWVWASLKARRVLCMSIATVMGPTPPGTGVRWLALGAMAS